VVLWGTLAGGKRYSARQYAHAALTTGGCSLFVLAGDITTGSAARLGGAAGSSGSAVVGGLLLLAYLAADGWTSTAQERLFRRYATPIREQLLFTTAFSAAYSLGVTLASRQLAPALAFLRRHPDAVLAVTALSLASTVIQVCGLGVQWRAQPLWHSAASATPPTAALRVYAAGRVRRCASAPCCSGTARSALRS
jgi:adenosine 3'-phospho 5'-phosphosulfate transporter B2